MALFLHFLGNPYIELDGQRLVFTLRKAEMMIIYVALNGSVTRNQLKAAFWQDMSGSQASANLRNALYLIRNAIPEYIDIDRDQITLKNFEDDVSKLAQITDPDIPMPKDIEEEPLRGFCIADSDEFDEQVVVIRQSIRRRITSWLRARISNCYEKKLPDELSGSLEVLLAIEPYDEDSVLELMEVYCNMGQPAKALVLFNAYSSRVWNKLGITPSERARAYFRKIIISAEPDKDKEMHGESGEKFWCRKNELALLLDSLTGAGGQNTAVYVYGEAGIGKTALINRAISVLDRTGTLVLSSRSCVVGEGYPYSSWNNIMTQIGRALEENNDYPGLHAQSVLSGIFPGFLNDRRLNYNVDVSLMTERNPIVISGMVTDLLRRISAKRKVILVFEDIHWFDSQSLELLTAFISTVTVPLDIIISGRPESSKITLAMLQNLNPSARWKIIPLKLDPLRSDEIIHICKHTLPDTLLRQKGNEYFVRESEGIPLLLFEMLRAAAENPDSDITNGLGGLIMARIGELSGLQQDILMALSVFAVGAEPAQIAEVVGKPQGDILSAAEALLSKGLLNERPDDGRVIWDFIHVKVRDCIYGSISLSKRQELHRGAAAVLNRRYSPQKWDPNLSAMLSHHYLKSGQKGMQLQQYIRELIFDITLNHDLFPVVPDKVLLSCSTPFSSKEETERKIRQAMSLLDEIRADNGIKQEDLSRLEASCFELAGGYHISWGEYESGMVYISEAIKLSKAYGFTDTQIHCLRHISYMYMQTENAAKLLSTARDLLALARSAEKMQYMATAVRFVGMAWLMSGKYDHAEKTFRHSIRLFEKLRLTGRSYTLSILVAKCYIGEIFQIRGDYKTALSYFSSCTDTCEEMRLYWGRSYFHTHAANLGLDMNDMALLFSHIDKAVSLFEGYQGGRCGSMLYSLKAVADAERGDIDAAELSVARGELFLKDVARKEWTATQFLAKAWVISKIRQKGHTKYHKSALAPFSAAECAGRSAGLYRECGMSLRAAWIENKFMGKK